MTPRERLLATLLFKTPDRIPLEPGAARIATRENWYKQGLPRDVEDYNGYAYKLAGGKLELPGWERWLPVNERMIPQFEEKILEERGSSRVVQDWKGNICEISSQYPVEYLRNAVDFVTRRWIKCPVETRADWEDMKRRYDAADPSRYDEAVFREMAAPGQGRGWPCCLSLSGPFWQLREWLGFENLCELLVEDPDFAGEMFAFWGEYGAKLLESSLRRMVPDIVRISEDMAYKMHSMISPGMARRHILPIYRRWSAIILEAGVPVFAVDSDGYVDEMMPVWIEGGLNCLEPMEVAAGSDLAALRRKYGRAMAFRGGVDKRAMAKGGKAIEDEIKRIEPVIRDGGFIPSCDHGVPADVSWPKYVEYVGLLAKATGWL